MTLNEKTKSTIAGIVAFFGILALIILFKVKNDARQSQVIQTESTTAIKVKYIPNKPDSNYSKPQTEVFDHWIKMDSTRFKQ